jgi:hypothetical protein
VSVSASRSWSRRRFLRAAGVSAGVAALLPYIPRLASADVPPARRLITFTMPMTSLKSEWVSTGSGAPFISGAALPALDGAMLSPLAPHASKLVVLDGIEPTVGGALYGTQPQTAGPAFFSTGHFMLPTLWTGTRQIPYGPIAAPEPPLLVGVTRETTARGWSIDQAVHARLAASTPHLQSLQLSCCEGYDHASPDNQSCVSFGAPLPGSSLATQLFPSANPQHAFDQIFGGITDPRGARRRGSVLDLVQTQMTRLRAQLPSGDRARLDAHHQGIVDLEARIRAGEAACIPPPRAESWDRDRQVADPRECARVVFELMRLAFECDLVRCVSFVCSTEQDGIPPQSWDPTLPVTRSPDDNRLHPISHDQDHDADARIVMRAFNRSMLGALADLASTLERGANTMASTIIAVQGTMSNAATHSSRVPPCLLIAGTDTPIQTDQYVALAPAPPDGERGDTVDHNRLLTTLAHAMGLEDVTTFGDVGDYAPVSDPSGPPDEARPLQHGLIAEVLR